MKKTLSNPFRSHQRSHGDHIHQDMPKKTKQLISLCFNIKI